MITHDVTLIKYVVPPSLKLTIANHLKDLDILKLSEFEGYLRSQIKIRGRG